MAVYVDPMRRVQISQSWQYADSCHMIADSRDELNDMAGILGLSLWWIQKPGTAHEHYDLTPWMRELAVERGAKEISVRGMAAIMFAKRQTLIPATRIVPAD